MPLDEPTAADPHRDDEAFAVSSEELSELFQRSADLACVADSEGYLRWVSPSWTRVLGWDQDELLAHPFAHFLHPADVERTAEVVAGIFEGRTVEGFENRYRTRKGGFVRIEWGALGQQREDGLIFAIGRDVTRLHETQVLLEERARMAELAEELVGVGRWWVDLHTNETVWSPTIYEIYGRDPALGPPSVEDGINGYHPDDREMVATAVSRVAQEGGEFSFRARILREDQSVRHIESAGSAEVNEDGDVTALFGVFRDITEELEMQERLVHAERMASLGTMSAGVAHEINNPLTWLGGSLEVLHDQLDGLARSGAEGSQDLLELVRSARDGEDRIRRIVRGLHAFSHAGVQRDLVRIADALEATISVVENEIRHRARFEADVDPEVRVLADVTQLGQIFTNLLMNAAQAIEAGHASENLIRLTVESDPSGWSVVRIEDTGCGIPDHVARRVWDPFFTTKPVGVGLGLGLPIVHNLVEQHGGTIALESQDGVGTTATIHFPAPASTLGEERRADAEIDTPTEEMADALGVAVLLVDDEPAILTLIARALDGAFPVETASSGAEAIALLEARPDIGVVCCDMMMPDVSGMDVWRWLEQNRPELLDRTVFMTGGAFSEESRRFLADNDLQVLSKPFSVKEIRRRLVELGGAETR